MTCYSTTSVRLYIEDKYRKILYCYLGFAEEEKLHWAALSQKKYNLDSYRFNIICIADDIIRT